MPSAVSVYSGSPPGLNSAPKLTNLSHTPARQHENSRPNPPRELGISFSRSGRSRLGEGSFGYVVAAKDLVAGKRVAIKKIKDALEDEIDGKRLLRELKFLRHCRGHENFIIIKARAPSCMTCVLTEEL